MRLHSVLFATSAALAGCGQGASAPAGTSGRGPPPEADAASVDDRAAPAADSSWESIESSVAAKSESSVPALDAGSVDSGVDASSDATTEAAPIPCGTAAARGATLPYQEYEAEDGTTTGTRLGPSRSVNDPDVLKSIAGESSGRVAVKLTNVGEFVQFQSQCAANGVVVRYAMPDSPDGTGQQASLGLYVNHVRVQSLSLTSHFAWAYGNPQTTTATTNNPSDGYARHFYDEARVLLPSGIPAGATVALQKDASDNAAYYVIDLVDLEQVAAPLARPANSLSIADYGATPNDASDDSLWIRNCFHDAQAQGKSVWIPPGTFQYGSMTLAVQNIKVQGAGMWYSTLQGAAAHFACTDACQFSDLSLFGDVTQRDDTNSIHGLSGSFGSGSRIDNVWLEHFTTGPWIGAPSAATSGLVVHGCRFRDLFADGINLTDGTSNSVVEQTHARSTGDDAFASWSIGTSPPNTNNVFRFDTAQLPWRANCYSIYGGTSNGIEDSVCADTVTYPGILIEQGFQSHAFSGTTTVARNTLLRSGGNAFGAHWGAFTVMGFEQAAPITGVEAQDLDIEAATFSGIFVSGPKDAINDLALSNVTIRNPGTYGIEVDTTAVGSAAATNVVVTNPGAGAGLNNLAPASWSFSRGSGNAGW